jgi:N-acetylmuramoyl-L-alanine amidase
MAGGADYYNAEWIPTTHYFSGRNGQRAAWIILHGTAGGSSAQEVAQWFVSNNPPTSTHYIIGQDGTVVQCVHESDSAWGNGVLSAGHASWWNPAINPNFQTFSIEHVKPDPNNQTSLTEAQQAASFALVAYLCAKWQIPPRAADSAGGITGHFSIDPVNRWFCPGTYPWSDLWAYLSNPASELLTLNYVSSSTGTLARAPLSPGILGIVEQIDEWEQIPPFPNIDIFDLAAGPGGWFNALWNVVPWAVETTEAGLFRSLIVAVGVLIVILVVFNTMKQIAEPALQVAGPVIQAAAAGAL